MANELTLGVKATYAKSGTSLVFPDLAKQTLNVTISGTRFFLNRQTIGFAAWEALILGDLAAGGYCYIVNRDSTNYVLVKDGSAEGDNSLIRLNAGDIAIFRLSPAATIPSVKADTANVEIEYLLLQD